MADTTVSDRSGPSSQHPHHPHHPMMTRRRWEEVIAGVAICCLAVGFVGGYSLGRHFGDEDQNKAQMQITNLQNQTYQLNKTVTDQNGKIDTLTKDLKAAKDDLAQIFQPARQLTLEASRSVRVSIGAFTIGLVRGLGETNVKLNVDGKETDMTTGSHKDLNFNCRVELDSFSVAGATAVAGSSDIGNSSATINTNCWQASAQGNNPNSPANNNPTNAAPH